MAKKPTSSVPRMPQVPWTDTALTGSSIRSRSMSMMLATTAPPQMAPMQIAPIVLTAAHPAVMPTSPASAPLAAMPTSGFPRDITHEIAMATTEPAAAASVVVTAMTPMTSPSAASCDPGLKPYHPTSSTNVPSTTNGTECPWMVRGLPSAPYLPMRGPSAIAPIRAAIPPVACTIVEPAKSIIGVDRWASQPPPHSQWTTTG